jgi:hypothetical protein
MSAHMIEPFEDRNPIDKNRTFKLMQDRNLAKVYVHFSGGNDEGGADGYHAWDAAGNEATLPVQNYYPWNDGTVRYQDAESGEWVERPATDEEKAVAEFIDHLEAPIYARYGSFAGEFSVSGEVQWDAMARTCHVDANEQSGHYDDVSWDE